MIISICSFRVRSDKPPKATGVLPSFSSFLAQGAGPSLAAQNLTGLVIPYFHGVLSPLNILLLPSLERKEERKRRKGRREKEAGRKKASHCSPASVAITFFPLLFSPASQNNYPKWPAAHSASLLPHLYDAALLASHGFSPSASLRRSCSQHSWLHLLPWVIPDFMATSIVLFTAHHLGFGHCNWFQPTLPLGPPVNSALFPAVHESLWPLTLLCISPWLI